ncbi:hypothetical protein T10_10144 [Trichinella papuae]|uniref:Uncharacterized protein n=1 Tax=Trichinella papuae TaxID=268474 RepID=A0A0V1M7I2_9BILA|nr:hypothetical protein T10_10144 [Trichinella papuae]
MCTKIYFAHHLITLERKALNSNATPNKNKLDDQLLILLVALMPLVDTDRIKLSVALLRKMLIFSSSMTGVGNLLSDRCWMPCKSYSFKVNFQENSLFLPATRVLTVVMAAYMRKTADPPNLAQYGIRDSRCHISKTFVFYFLLSRYVANKIIFSSFDLSEATSAWKHFACR